MQLRSPIPLAVHQIWIQGDAPPRPPPLLAALMSHVRQVCAQQGFSYRAWSERDLYDDMAALDPRLCRIYDSAPSFAAKSDILRLVALYLHGGIYLDTDCAVLQPGQLSWLVAGAPRLVLLNFGSPYEDSIGAKQLFGETNNCFIAAPARSPDILALLRTVAGREPFDPGTHSRFSWTMATAGPDLYLDLIRRLPGEGEVRFLPRAVVMGEYVSGVDEGGFEAMLSRLRREFPSAVILHAESSMSGGSWMPGPMASAGKVLQRISKRASRHAALLMITLCLVAVVGAAILLAALARAAHRSWRGARKRH